MQKIQYKKVRTNFGKYEEIPIEWDSKCLSEVVDFRQGLQIAKVERYIESAPNRIKLIKVVDFDPTKGSNEYIKIPSKKSVICNKDDIIIARTGTLGLVLTNVEGVFHNNTFAIDYNRSIFDKLFFYYYLQSPKVQQFIKIISTRTSQGDLTHHEFSKLIVFIPPFSEQIKIASILSNICQLIQKTERIIEDTQRLKKGLMQKLLTKGIAHTKFKEVVIGPRYVVLNIPISWNISTLDSIVSQSISYGILVPEEDHNGVPMIRSGEIGTPGGIERNLMIISKKLEEKYKKTRLNGGEILMALVGATIGKLTVAPNWCKGYNVSRAIAVIRLYKEFIPEFFAYFLKTDLIQKKIRVMTSGSAQPVINLEEISKFKVVVPPPQEQKRIVSILNSIENQIILNQRSRLLLLEQKKSLMQQLLTGKIRVKV